MRNVVFTEPPDIEIIYQDEYMVAINKPSGLLVHRSEIDKRETLFAIQLTRDTIGQRVYPVHRLDRPTSGVLLFALSPQVSNLLCRSFLAGEVNKTYQAMVRGYAPESQTIDYPLKEILDKFADKNVKKDKPAQDAVTRTTRLATAELPFATGRYPQSRYSLVELTPQTGRKHQLRRHMAHIRHPIIGDTNHGDGKQNQSARDKLNLHRLALTARSLTLPHPITKQTVTISAKLDLSLTAIYNRCGWQNWI